MIQRLFQPANIQLVPQNFFSCLGQQQILWVILLEHFKEQTTGSLHLSRAFWRAGVPGKYQPGDSRNLAKAAQGQFAGIEAGNYVSQQALGAQQPCIQQLGPLHLGGAQQLQAIIIHRNRKGQRLLLADPPCQQTG